MQNKHKKNTISILFFLILLFCCGNTFAQVVTTDPVTTGNAITSIKTGIQDVTSSVNDYMASSKILISVGNAAKGVSEFAKGAQEKLKKAQAKFEEYKTRVEEVKAKAEEYKELVEDTIETTKNKYEEAKSKVEEVKSTVEEYKAAAEGAVDAAKSKAEELTDKVDAAKDKIAEKTGSANAENNTDASTASDEISSTVSDLANIMKGAQNNAEDSSTDNNAPDNDSSKNTEEDTSETSKRQAFETPDKTGNETEDNVQDDDKMKTSFIISKEETLVFAQLGGITGKSGSLSNNNTFVFCDEFAAYCDIDAKDVIANKNKLTDCINKVNKLARSIDVDTQKLGERILTNCEKQYNAALIVKALEEGNKKNEKVQEIDAMPASDQKDDLAIINEMLEEMARGLNTLDVLATTRMATDMYKIFQQSSFWRIMQEQEDEEEG